MDGHSFVASASGIKMDGHSFVASASGIKMDGRAFVASASGIKMVSGPVHSGAGVSGGDVQAEV